MVSTALVLITGDVETQTLMNVFLHIISVMGRLTAREVSENNLVFERNDNVYRAGLMRRRGCVNSTSVPGE